MFLSSNYFIYLQNIYKINKIYFRLGKRSRNNNNN